MARSNVLLLAEDICRRSTTGLVLLDRLSIAIAAGDRWAVTGPTGSGKTLLLRALALLDPLDSGRILWKGHHVPDEEVPAYRRRVVYLHQRPVLLRDRVELNLWLPFRLAGMAGSQIDRDRLLDHLAAVGLNESFLKKPSRDLSGGEQQIVALLRAFQMQPSILLLDESTAALDATSREAVERLVSQWREESETERATVWVSHDESQIERMADKVLALSEGHVQSGHVPSNDVVPR